ncbi:hypothetical protein ABZ370_41265 [Streptomyces sp. NPDC005962]|uniref:hypothetical protein n=1 Tax=Streptomyces sp. NPDC005962 TaxID=3154466 RepID=UPI0033CB170C
MPMPVSVAVRMRSVPVTMDRRVLYTSVCGCVRRCPVYFADFWARRDEFADFPAGRRDFICGPRWAVMLRDGIPGARLTVIPQPRVGHIDGLPAGSRTFSGAQ